MPPDLHAQLAQAAEREGSSLNGYITARLRESVDGAPADPSVRDGSSNATLTRVLVVNSVAVAFAAAVALVILLVAWLG